MGTSIIDCCRCRGAAGSVLPMNIASLHRASPAPVDHHLRPFRTYSSPSETIDARIFVASDEATSGSVIAKHDLISPSSSGRSHSSFCSAVPYFSSTSILPVSGAEQLNTSEAHTTRPIVSASGAYSTFVSPETSGKNKFHNRASFAFAFSPSTSSSGRQRSPSFTSSRKRVSFG